MKMRSNHPLRYLLLVCMLVIPFVSIAGDLAPFTSDGCSAFPDGTFEQNELWLECCTAHDFAYWRGGSYDQRLEADKELKNCVAQVGEPAIALLMLAGVRVGGSPFFPTTFRWGYGWPYPRFYGTLSEEELEQIRRSTNHSLKGAIFQDRLNPVNDDTTK